MSKLIALAIIIIAFAIFRSQLTAGTKAFLLITQEFPQIPIKPLLWISQKPNYQKIEYEAGGQKVVADLVTVQDSRKLPALILAMGVRTQEKDKPVILHFADTMARLGYVVMWPRLDTLDIGIPSFEKPETFIEAFKYLEKSQEVDPTRISYLGFSVGSSVALVAASNRQIADKVRAVIFFGGYYDVAAYLDVLGGKGDWQPSEGAIRHVDEILKERGLKTVDELPAKELATIDPSKHIANLKAKVFILHDKGDSYVPYFESLKLDEALSGKVEKTITLVNLFEHVQPKKGFDFAAVGEFVKLYGFVTRVLGSL